MAVLRSFDVDGLARGIEPWKSRFSLCLERAFFLSSAFSFLGFCSFLGLVWDV